jgi:hypothetical protein
MFDGQFGINPPEQKRLVGEESGLLTKTGVITQNPVNECNGDFTTVILHSTSVAGGIVGWDCIPIDSGTASCFTSALRLAVES